MTLRASFFVLLSLMCLAVTSARAADVPLPPVLEKLKTDGAVVAFMGHLHGVDGWLVTGPDGAPKYAYTTKEGGLLLGVLFNPDGTNATAVQARALKSRADGGQGALPGADKSSAAGTKAERLYAQVETAAWAASGNKDAPYLYMFINTGCDHCQKFWNDLAPARRAGQVQIRLVPFGKVTENRESGAALLSVDDPGAAWEDFMRGNAAALASDKAKAGTMEKVDANTALYGQWKLQGPPFTLYRKPETGEIMAVAGRPENVMLVLADLMPKKKE